LVPAGRAFLEDPFLAEMSTAATYQPAWSGPAIKNGNKLLNLYPGAFGVKIGHTGNARQTIVAAAERGGRQLSGSVLGSTDRYSDTIRLLDWAFASLPDGCAAH
jgi:D-alanyl-D-alanine carboxypeptidase